MLCSTPGASKSSVGVVAGAELVSNGFCAPWRSAVALLSLGSRRVSVLRPETMMYSHLMARHRMTRLVVRMGAATCSSGGG